MGPVGSTIVGTHQGGIPEHAVNANSEPANAANQALKAIDVNDNDANVGAALTRPPTDTRDQPGLSAEQNAGPPERPPAASSDADRCRAQDEP